MSEKTTFVSFLLDETGSMHPIKQDTIGGFNAYLETLQEGDADILFSLVTFNSNETKRHYVAKPVHEVAPLTADDYLPEAMTPLIDAAVKIIKATDEAVLHRGDDSNVVIVMQTDGLENVSVEYTRPDLAALIKEKKAAGWEFVFLGAGLDAFEAARAAGIHLSARHVMSYSRLSSRQAFASTAGNVKEYAELGDAESLNYRTWQRKRAGDEYTHRHLDQDGGPTSGGGGSARRSRRKLRDASARVKRTGKSTVDEVDLSKP